MEWFTLQAAAFTKIFHNDDKILSLLSHDFIGRNIFKVEVTEGPSKQNEQEGQIITDISERYGIDEADVKRYLTSSQMVGRDMYSTAEDKIEILMKDGTTKDISEVSDMLNVDTLSKKVRKKFFCYQR